MEADSEVPTSPEACWLGGLLDAHHPASHNDQHRPRGSCHVCGSLMYKPDEVLRHLPSAAEFARVQNWLEDHPVDP